MVGTTDNGSKGTRRSLLSHKKQSIEIQPNINDKSSSKPEIGASETSPISLEQISKLKFMIMKKRHELRKRQRHKLSSMNENRSVPTTDDDEEHENVDKSTYNLNEQSERSVLKPIEKCRLGTFETQDIKWKALLEGDIEKFMYPSLKLEKLYDIKQDGQPETPSSEQVDTAMKSKAIQIGWELEKRFQNASLEPLDGHLRMDDSQLHHRQFDQKLEAGEALLWKKDLILLEAKKEKQALATALDAGKSGIASLPGHHSHVLLNGTSWQKPDVESSLYSPHVINQPQQIPRLPQTRKVIKEIQRHTSDQGQIAYYSNKQNLFTKWKHLQVSELHKGPSTDESLSPRSLFYHECIKNNVLPEPFFSRVNDVQYRQLPQVVDSMILKKETFPLIADTLVQAVHQAAHNGHEDVIAMSNGKGFIIKKHHLSLYLQHFGLGDIKMQALSISLQSFQSIHILNLKDNRLTDRSIIPLLQYLEFKPGNHLRMLNLSQNVLGTNGCIQIATFLSCCTSLTHLDLSHTNIGTSDEIGPLTRAIQIHCTLQVLNLGYNRIDAKSATLIGQMLEQSTCCIVELDLGWNQISKQGAIAIGRALRQNTKLKVLNIAMNRFSDVGGEQVAASMAHNHTLTDLNLSQNNIQGRTAISFAYYLRFNRILTHLNLKDNPIGTIGIKALLRTVCFGSHCDFEMTLHDIDKETEQDVFDVLVPSMLSPFQLDLEMSPYDYAIANELITCATQDQTCRLENVVYTLNQKQVFLNVGMGFGLIETTTGHTFHLEPIGMLCMNAIFVPPMIRTTRHLNPTACQALLHVIKRGTSNREVGHLLDLALNDLFMTTELATIFLSPILRTGFNALDSVEIIGRLWPCLIDGHHVFDFLQTHLTSNEQRRLVDLFGMSTIQFTTANPTGHWSLDLKDRRQRKIALWFAMINAQETQINAELHSKRIDASQYGKACNWRNVTYNRQPIQMNESFLTHLPQVGLLEFDYISTSRYEDIEALSIASDQQPIQPLTDIALETLLSRTGAEVCSIYIPLHKRKDLKYQLLFFHLAMGEKYLTCQQAHHVLQYFPKNLDSCRYRVLLSLHRHIIDLEHFNQLLIERLIIGDQQRIYQTLGYLNVLNPFFLDMEYKIQFDRDDEKMLLRGLVDLSMTCPMDMIRIDVEHSTVSVIYSMYQTNSVPSQGYMSFRYITHPIANRNEFIRIRTQLFKHFLCGERLRRGIENGELEESNDLKAG